MEPKQELLNFQSTKEFFIGIDSDGCAFDTMEIKHKECFCPNFIYHFNLQNISKYAREAWDFVNLYSKTRGCNRFHALLYAVELLGKRKEVMARNAKLPDMTPLIEWTKKESKLAEPILDKYVKENHAPVLEQALRWSKSLNKDIEEMVFGIPPFPNMRESLAKMQSKADVIVVSQTPAEALIREWQEHDIAKYVRLICGQEFGTKTEHLKYVAKGKYADNKILMIGDAPGDLKAAKDNNVLYFPINPGHEEKSWERFYTEALDKFFAGTYEGVYEKSLIDEFNTYLPEKPIW